VAGRPWGSDPVTVVEVVGLGVTRGDFTLGPVDLTIGPGVTAILGPNGSGKSTLLRAMNGLIPEARGRARVDGDDLMLRTSDTLERVAFVPDTEELLFSEMQLHEYWSFVATVRERTFGEDPEGILVRAEGFAERLGLQPGRRRIREFSMGMRRKAQLITGLMVDPQVLIVDEPQNGLDFVSANEVRAIFTRMSDEGRSVIMSNHDLDSVARMADRLVVLRHGQVVGQSADRFASGSECEAFVAGFFERA